jgi:hypothetical protein
MRALGFGAVVVVGLAIALWWWSSTNATPLPGPTPTRDTATTSVPSPTRVTPVESETRATAAERQPAVSAPPAGVPIRIRTVHADSGTHVGGATVAYAPAALHLEALPPELDQLRRRDGDAFLDAVGATVVTADDGRAELSPAHDYPYLIARKADLYGVRYGRSSTADEVSIPMQRDWTLTVRVVDPAGTPVAGAIVWGEAESTVPGEQRVRDWLGTTGEDGVYVGRHAQLSRMFSLAGPSLLQAVGPGAIGKAERVDPAEPPDAVELVLPATGTVVIRIERADGTPFDPKHLQSAAAELKAAEENFGTAIGHSRSLDAAGTARFDNVGLGWRLAAEFRAFDPHHRVEFDGPTEPGEIVTVTLRDSEESATIAGRLAFDDGTPIGLTDVTAHFVSDRTSGNELIRTDAEGRFRCRVGASFHRDETHLWLTPTDAESATPGWRADAVPTVFGPGHEDLGTLVAKVATRIASGRIEGVPELDPERVRFEVERQVHGDWTEMDSCRFTLATDGAFRITGVAAPREELRLEVRSQQFELAGPIPFLAGTENLRVVTRSAGPLEVTFIGDTRIASRVLDVHLLPSGTKDGREPIRSPSWRIPLDVPAATAMYRSVASGTWDVSVRHRYLRREVLRVPNVMVAPGQPPDPRLEEVDLRTALKTVWIRATDANGQPVAEGGSVLVPREERAPWEVRFAGGAAPLVLDALVDAWVHVPGHRLERVDGLFDDVEIALRSAPLVPVRFLLPAALPEGVAALAQLVPAGLPSSDDVAPRVALDGDCSARVPVRTAGRHALRLSLRRGSETVRVQTTRVDLDPDRLPAEVPVEVDFEELTRTLARW